MGAMSMVVNTLIASGFTPKKARVGLLNKTGAEIHKSVNIMPGCYFQSHKIKIGYKSYINRGLKMIDGGRQESVTIGNEVLIGPNCLLAAATHKINKRSSRRAGPGYSKPIVIKDGCWLGGNVTVLPDVTIAKGCIIAAGAVVTKSTQPDGLYAGVPARRIKDLECE